MRLVGWLAATFLCCAALVARADDAKTASLRLSFIPTDRAQIAVWVEKGDGTFMGTLALTHATATLGIGNRPGALQMNSGFRWPYGRREGVLPVWAHRRAAAEGAKQFRRVIFQNRVEGYASRTTNDMSRDDYYCLSFSQPPADAELDDVLDAVTCASVFSSDKGRFITEADLNKGYAEPFEDDGGVVGPMRPLSLYSLYPPRRDVSRCTSSGCYDHADVAKFKDHARSVMPELDAISRATPPGDQLAEWTFLVPETWSLDEDYVLFVEVNVEGDYNHAYNPDRYPTPCKDSCSTQNKWDSWAINYGYPYRGQPSVVYKVPFRLDKGTTSALVPVGYGDLHGQSGELYPLDDTITNSRSAPGSGVDRLRLLAEDRRLELKVVHLDPCALADAPPECGLHCTPTDNSCHELVCDEKTGTCQPYCVSTRPPRAVTNLRVEEYPDEQRAHMWAVLKFRLPESERPIGSFDVRVRAEGGDWEQAFTYDKKELLLPVALDVCADPDNPMLNRCPSLPAGTEIEAVLANLRQSTRYEVSVAPRDQNCGELGPSVTASFTTPARKFTTVSPCFVATAAYGSPLAAEITVLRRLRDRHLATNQLGRAFIEAYYRVGPSLARHIAEHAWLRSATRALLSPIVSVINWWMSDA